MIEMSTTLLGLDRCPHCGIASPNLLYRHYIIGPYSGMGDFAWITYQCNTCNDIVSAKGQVNISALSSNGANYLATYKPLALSVTPFDRRIDADIPERPRMYLNQAISSLHAPDGAVMLAASAIDAMLKLHDYETGSLYSRIEKAVEEHVLTPAMRDWAHAVRLESNKPRHADLEEPHASKERAEQIIKFAEALGEYLFSLPARVERGRERAVND